AQPQVPSASSTVTTRRQNSAKIAAVGVGAAGLAAVGGRSAARTVSGGGTPPTQGSAAGQGGSPRGPRPPSQPRILITLILLLVALVAACGVIAYASPGVFSHLNIPTIIPGLTPSATVTITPVSKDLKNTYTIFGVTGNPDPTLRQVQARLLTSTTPAQSRT